MGFKGIFKNKEDKLFDWLDLIKKNSNDKDCIYMLAVAHAIDLIAKMVSKTEIQIYKKNKKTKKIEETKDNLYWRLNIQPNLNENGTYFKYKLACKLLLDQKAIVVMNKISNDKPYLYLANSYNTDNSILYGKKYKKIELIDDEGNSLYLDKVYNHDEVLSFSFVNEEIKKATETYKSEISKILGVTSSKYIKSNLQKWRLKNPGNQFAIKDVETGEPITREEYKKKVLDGLLDEEDAIILLAEQLGLEDLNKDKSVTISNYKDMSKEIYDKVAMIFNIPLDVFYGSKTEKSTGTNDFITLAVDPILHSIETGCVIGLIDSKDFIAGENIVFNRFSMLHKDITELASSLDKLKGIGYSHNDINKFLGLPKVDEPWADEHYITKNYGNVKEEGGE